jgi:hypothetical protein
VPERTEQGTHFYFMVIQTSINGGTQVSENYGTLTPNEGATRIDLYEAVKADAIRRNPIAAHGAVIAFDIQPNKL